LPGFFPEQAAYQNQLESIKKQILDKGSYQQGDQMLNQA